MTTRGDPDHGLGGAPFGAKPVYVLSVVLFTVGSALCGLATSTTDLIVFRVLQGAGGGMILPIGQLMMADAAGPKRMGRVMSVVAVLAMLAPILGPTVGGLILDNSSWRWIFFVNLPIGVAAVIAALRVLPRIQPQPTDHLRTGRDRHHRKLHGGHGDRPLRARRDAGGGLRVARAAGGASAAEPAPVAAPHVLLRLDRDVLPRRGAVRRDDPAAALLAGRASPERRRHGPADRAAGSTSAPAPRSRVCRWRC